MQIRLDDDNRTAVEATLVRHLRTLTGTGSGGTGSTDVDLYRLADGSEVVAEWYGDARQLPVVNSDVTAEQYA